MGPPLRCPPSQRPNAPVACVRAAVACRMRARVPLHMRASAVRVSKGQVRQLRDVRRLREADTMQHARYECPSATLQRTLKRRRSLTYQASGVFSVTSANSAFSAALPVAAICSSCKPTPLFSDGCGAAAMHSMCGSRDQFRAGTRAAYAAPDHLIGLGYRQMRLGLHVARAHACVRKLLAPVAACYMRHETDGMQHAACNMQHPYSGYSVCVR